MNSIQNGQMSHEQVRRMFNEWRQQLDELEIMVMEGVALQGARWDFPEGNYSVLATWLLYDPTAHMLFPVTEKKSWAELGNRLTDYVGWTVDWYSLRRTYTRKSLKKCKKRQDDHTKWSVCPRTGQGKAVILSSNSTANGWRQPF